HVDDPAVREPVTAGDSCLSDSDRRKGTALGFEARSGCAMQGPGHAATRAQLGVGGIDHRIEIPLPRNVADGALEHRSVHRSPNRRHGFPCFLPPVCDATSAVERRSAYCGTSGVSDGGRSARRIRAAYAAGVAAMTRLNMAMNALGLS